MKLQRNKWGLPKFLSVFLLMDSATRTNPQILRKPQNWKRHIPAFLLFLFLAAILVGRSLFAGGKQICAADAPDSWIHMWAFWRANYAILGHDHSYLLSHTLTYPGIVREPIAIFDPLLSLLSIPIQLITQSCAIAFNWLVFFGLIFTGMAGYVLGLEFGGRRSTAIITGLIIVANPFTYWLIAGGYTEYAWWGLLPLTIALYHRSIQSTSRWSVIGYIAAFLTMLLMSIYCAFYFVIFAAASLFLNLLHARRRSSYSRLKRLIKVQLTALTSLAPLLLLWIYMLSLLGWKNVEYPHPFPVDTVQSFSAHNMDDSGNHDDDRLVDIAQERIDTSPKRLVWRTLMGSLDISELTNLTRSWRQKYPPPPKFTENGSPQTKDQTLVYIDENIFAREWILVIALAVLAFFPRRQRRESGCYALLALAFFVLALGPLPIWNGRVTSLIPLPYAWLYHWVPGFSRFFIPARMFLGTIVCLAILAQRGAKHLNHFILQHTHGIPPAAVNTGIAILLLLGFVISSYHGISLPQTGSQAPSIYSTIHDESGSFALLELPTGGSSSRRMYYQSIHGRPVYGGLIAEEWTDENGAEEVQTNPLVLAMEHPSSASSVIKELRIAAESLSRHGFRYLILHKDGYDRASDYTAAIDLARSILNAPVFADREISVWRLPPNP